MTVYAATTRKPHVRTRPAHRATAKTEQTRSYDRISIIERLQAPSKVSDRMGFHGVPRWVTIAALLSGPAAVATIWGVLWIVYKVSLALGGAA